MAFMMYMHSCWIRHHTRTPVGQNVQKVTARCNRRKGYVLTREIPVGTLDNKYPLDPNTFGEKN
jgi:hypothetical protein